MLDPLHVNLVQSFTEQGKYFIVQAYEEPFSWPAVTTYHINRDEAPYERILCSESFFVRSHGKLSNAGEEKDSKRHHWPQFAPVKNGEDWKYYERVTDRLRLVAKPEHQGCEQLSPEQHQMIVKKITEAKTKKPKPAADQA